MKHDEKSEEVCAPGVKYLGGSCITIDLLEDMIKVYNSSHNDKIDTSKFIHLKNINPITYKRNIVETMKQKMKQYKCDTQTCWLTLPFFKKLSDMQKTKKLHRDVFKPIGPKNTTEWLNTFNINDVFTQYERIYPEFKFMGAHPSDFDKLPSTGIPNLNFNKLMQNGIFKLGFIFNLDKHDEPGSHWVALYANLKKGQIYYIDSVGEPPMEEFKILMERIKTYCQSLRIQNIDARFNKKQHQHGNSECGVYAISFILRLLDGESFDEISNNKVTDEEIKLCRSAYFRL